MLRRLLKDYQPEHIAVVFNAKGKTFRDELYPEYKAHRPPAPEDLVPQFPLIRDATRAFNLPCIEMGGFEADDLIATYARQAAASGASVRIVSSDKDLMQLIVEGVIQLYDPMKNRARGPEAVMEKFGVTPDRVIDAQALIGDSTDNVPGAPGIGPKTAAELIATFGSLDAILERAHEVKQQKYRAKYKKDNPNLLLYQELQAAGVKMFVCGQSIVNRKIDRNRMVPEVKPALSMLTTVTTYQLKGYAYLRFWVSRQTSP